MPCPRTAGHERRPGQRCQRPVRVTVERGDRVHTSGVVIDIYLPDHLRCGRGARRFRAEPATINASGTAKRNTFIRPTPLQSDRGQFPGTATLPTSSERSLSPQ
jgi:hypothetical protein